MHDLISASSTEANPPRVSVLTVGDTLRPLVRRLVTGRANDATPIDLTGLSVTFMMTDVEGTVLKVDAAATIVEAEAGIVSYSWQAADVDEAGDFAAWFIVEDTGDKETFPSNGPTEILRFVEAVPAGLS
jgi:hypothetical protein